MTNQPPETGPAGELPIDSLIFRQFNYMSSEYPQSLVGVSSAVGFAAINAIELGWFSLDDFKRSSLHGDQLDQVVDLTISLHNKNGVDPARNERLATIMPVVYNLAKYSIISSISELAKGDEGRQLHTVTRVSDDEVAAVEDYLRSGAGAMDVLGLLGSNSVVLGELTRDLGKAYQGALIGQDSDMFPDAKHTNTQQKKQRLAELVRPRLTEAVISRVHLPQPQVATFMHNITRP